MIIQNATVPNHGLCRKNNLNIDVHDGISPEPPKVIIINLHLHPFTQNISWHQSVPTNLLVKGFALLERAQPTQGGGV